MRLAPAGWRFMLQSRSKIHGAADHCVVHSVLAAEITDRALPGVDTDPALQRRLDAAVAPFFGKLANTLLHMAIAI